MAGGTKKRDDQPEQKKATGAGPGGTPVPSTKPSARQPAAELDEDEDFDGDFAEAASGTPDPDYDLVSVLYHALQGAETYAEFVDDAEDAGDRELAEFFLEVQREETMRAERAKQLLATRLARGSTARGDDTARGLGTHS
ncbi:hypothetical protein L6R52_07810 [Myxococcota bacterium]|nr:hypothetical protein [Myxococcota bacterium]